MQKTSEESLFPKSQQSGAYVGWLVGRSIGGGWVGWVGWLVWGSGFRVADSSHVGYCLGGYMIIGYLRPKGFRA